MNTEIKSSYNAAFMEHTDTLVQENSYSAILDKFNLSYSTVGYYIQVGDIIEVESWILHISVVRFQITQLLEVLLPVLSSNKVSFKIAKDKDTCKSILDGELGLSQLGKVICIYPTSTEQLVKLAKILIEITHTFTGPSILTDIRLGNIIYTCYGSFKPIILFNALGRYEQFTHNSKGELIPENNSIPFEYPQGIDWPFRGIMQPHVIPAKKLLKEEYKPVATLKFDAKGSVIKAIYLKYRLIPKLCIIKQGKKNMWSDDSNRDMHDRLRWQYTIHKQLSRKVPLPKILDLFIEEDDMYLVMQFIKGNTLHEYISEINPCCLSWKEIPLVTKLKVLNYILDLVKLIEIMHSNGYVHRDITPVNFLIDEKGKLVLIDIELAYFLDTPARLSPFEFGTIGFMSPEQIERKIPTYKEDIFGIGATILTLVTGLPPIVFDTKNKKSLIENINFFIEDELLAQTISTCLSAHPKDRPTTTDIHLTIQKCVFNLKTSGKKQKPNHADLDKTVITDIIEDAIKGLATYPTVIHNNLWHSKISTGKHSNDFLKNEFGKSCSLYEGISGILYTLAIAQKVGLNINACRDLYEINWRYIKSEYLQQITYLAPGFYGGAAGIALAMSLGMDTGLIQSTEENKALLQSCFGLTPTGLDVATGIAGQAIAALQCNTYLTKSLLKTIIHKSLNKLLTAQQSEGYWITLKGLKGKFLPSTSFSHGNSGIVWLLIEGSTKFQDLSEKIIVLRALDTMYRQAKSLLTFIKEYGYRKLYSTPYSYDETIGLLLVFMKAYEIYGLEHLKETAENILYTYPDELVHENFSQDLGMSGLGELYLEAYRVFNNSRWLKRAEWIANFFLHTYRKESDGNLYWLSNNLPNATADFTNGNSGIIHFLIRYTNMEKIGYRLLK